MSKHPFQLRAVIFDFDGVLFDTEPLHYRAFAEALPAFDLRLTEADYFDRYVGLNDRTLTARMLKDRGRDPSTQAVEQILSRKDNAYMRLIGRGLEPLPGVRQFLEFLSSQMPLAICSGARRVEIETLLRASSLLEYFPDRVTSDDQPLSKPDPAGFLQALDLLQHRRPDLLAAECLIIEDSLHGMQAARAAGMKVAAIAARVPAARFAGADWIVPDMSSLHRQLIEEGVP